MIPCPWPVERLLPHAPPMVLLDEVIGYDADGVLAGMQMNLIDVGVANSGLFNVWTNKGENMNLIHSGKGVPHLTFGVRGDLPESEKRTITEALLKATQDKDAQEFLRFSNFPGFEPAKLSDYDELAKMLNIK